MLGTIRPQFCRPGPIPRRPVNQKPPGELGEKGNECVEEGDGTERLAPPRVRKMPPRPMPPRTTPPRPMLVKPEKPRKKPSRKPSRKPQRGDVGIVPAGGMILQSRAITAIKRAIMPSIAPSRKISGSPDDSQGPCNAFSAFDAASRVTRPEP